MLILKLKRTVEYIKILTGEGIVKSNSSTARDLFLNSTENTNISLLALLYHALGLGKRMLTGQLGV